MLEVFESDASVEGTFNINNERTDSNLILNDLISGNDNNISIPDVIPVPHSINDTSNNPNLVHCKGCKKNCAPDLFTDLTRGKTFKQCGNCRQRKNSRRHPESLQAQPNENRLCPTISMC